MDIQFCIGIFALLQGIFVTIVLGLHWQRCTWLCFISRPGEYPYLDGVMPDPTATSILSVTNFEIPYSPEQQAGRSKMQRLRI